MPLSEEFLDAFLTEKSIVTTCGHCGTTYFNEEDASFFDPGELEELQRKAKEFPDKFKASEGVYYGNTGNGKCIVDGCCMEKLVPFEKFVWGQRFKILRYLKLRAEANLLLAKLDVQACDTVPEKGL